MAWWNEDEIERFRHEAVNMGVMVVTFKQSYGTLRQTMEFTVLGLTDENRSRFNALMKRYDDIADRRCNGS